MDNNLITNGEIKTVKHDMFGDLEILIINGKEYFPATDVAKKLGYVNPRDAILRHCNPKGVHFHDALSNGGNQQKKFINEGNLYRLIASSKLPEAEKFESWVFEEVIPTIRKTGGYINNTDQIINTYYSALDESQKMMLRALFTNIEKQQKQISVMQPKSDYFDNLVERNLLLNFRDTAKEIKVKQKVFITFLEENKYIYRDSKNRIKPYAQHTPELFQIKEFAHENGAGNQTLITPKGRETFRLLLSQSQIS